MAKILVVDDDVDILEVMQMLLEEEGYEVVTTPKGEEAFAVIQEFKPDLILLDVLLSGKDGRHICKQIKSDPKTKKIPIVMLSAHPDADKSTKEAGANNFLAKPFETDTLLSVIQSHLQG